ncbi:MAG: cell division ATP-binding protein FtsE [Coriobacteriales bacterium]|nr:cell division ATP-binding protein FtsE [Coriobacteriales bacterium]
MVDKQGQWGDGKTPRHAQSGAVPTASQLAEAQAAATAQSAQPASNIPLAQHAALTPQQLAAQSGQFAAVAASQSGQFVAVAPGQSGQFVAVAPGQSGQFVAVAPNQSGQFVAVGAEQSGQQPTVLPGAIASPAQNPNRVPGARPVIVFENITKTYKAQQRRPALNGVSLEIYPGEFVFLVGHSGSGKSTFIRLINREFVATTGKLFVAGENLVKMHRWRVPYLRRNIGCVFQDFKLLPNKTAFENVAFALKVIGKSRHIIRTQVPEVLRLVGLEDKIDKYPDQLSGGEQQRVSIARAIVNRPPLLICDEPTGNLDPQTSLGIMRLLDRINRTGTTILVATHDREMVDSMRKRVMALENGYLVRDQHKGVYGEDA